MKYYAVTCLRGHVGRGYKVPITFYFQANNLLEAMDKGKKQPGVKHSLMPLQCKEISYELYKEKIQMSAYRRAGAK